MPSSWPGTSLFALGLGVYVLTIVELAWEWRSTRRFPRLEERASNWTCLVVTLLLRTITLPLRVGGFAWVAARAPLTLPTTWPLVAVCYVLVDLLYYVFHRILHRTSLGWAVHSVHHSSRAIELSVAFRLSWPARVVDDFFYLPLVLVGFSPALVLLAIELNLLWQVGVHTEMVGRLGVIDRWLNTPSNHRVHHHVAPQGRHHNYGGHFMIWDRLFGTYQPEGERQAYGSELGDLGPNPIRIQLAGLRRLVSCTRADSIRDTRCPPHRRPRRVQPRAGSAGEGSPAGAPLGAESVEPAPPGVGCAGDRGGPRSHVRPAAGDDGGSARPSRRWRAELCPPNPRVARSPAGDGTTADRPDARPVAGIERALGVTTGDHHACALVAGGTVHCWGDNGSGQLGDGSRARRASPVAVRGLPGAAEIAAGARFTCARLTDGHARCWGSNEHGALGNGSGRDELAPVEVAGLDDAVEIVAGREHACARRRAGDVLCWGWAMDAGATGDVPPDSPVVVPFAVP